MVVLPGILAVEHQRDQRAPVGGALADRLDAGGQVEPGVARVPVVVGEADGVGQGMVAEDGAHAAAVPVDAVGLVEDLLPPPVVLGRRAAEFRLEGAVENLLVGRQPAEALPDDQRDEVFGYRTFRRPEPGRQASKDLAVELDRAGELQGGVVRA